MKMSEIVPAPVGTYAGVRFCDETKKQLEEYCTQWNIPNCTPADKYHTTLLYSRKPCPNYKPLGDIAPPYVGSPKELVVWNTQPKEPGGPTARCLVLKFDCEHLINRHQSLMQEHQATYDYPEYLPHVTLSYDIGDMDHSNLPVPEFPLNVVHEYHEPLNLDWAQQNAKK